MVGRGTLGTMNTTRTRAAATIVVGLVALGACGGDDGSNEDAGPVDTEETSADESTDEIESTDAGSGVSGGSGSSGEAPSGDGVASIMLSLDGGADSGTHSAAAPDAGCSRFENAFYLQYSLMEREGFHSFQIEIDDSEAAATGNSAFAATAHVGENRYHLDRQSSAMLTLEDEGATATITISGTTAEGVDVSAIVECHQVIDLG